MGALGMRLRAARQAKGWSQHRLAALAGLSRSTVAALELGRYATCDTGTVAALAQALGVSKSRLLDDRPRRSVSMLRRADIVEDFLASLWPRALRLEPGEIAWLDTLPLSLWHDVAETPQAVAELLAWYRRHRLHPRRRPQAAKR